MQLSFTYSANKNSAGVQHVGAGKFRHLRRLSGPIYVDGGFFRSIYVADGIFRHLHVVLLRHTWLLQQVA
jgi:hypothetical protein